jgi:hypothetical protein
LKKQKDQWEEDAKNHSISALKAMGRADWIVSDTDVVDDRTNRNFDSQLRSGDSLIALEIFRLVQTQVESVRQRSWSKMAKARTNNVKAREPDVQITVTHERDV